MTHKFYKLFFQLANYVFFLGAAIILIQCNFNVSNVQGGNYSNFTSTPINPQATSATLPPLHLEAEDGDLAEVKLLLQNGEEVNATDDYGTTALHLASINGHLAVVRELLQHGADANIQDNDGCTPLHWAAQEGKLAIVNFLLQSGADANLQDNYADTPWQLATANNHSEVAKGLYGSDDERDNGGQ